ncbi:MAG TPA: ribbon-helix-helix domain-containing protein [Solirubrobacteraceae bacterium]|nr:ribbon-helix-helix domain-containing protein [Solirubrobacteraceae bacterium]
MTITSPGGMRGGMVAGMVQIAIRLADVDLQRLDAAVARGRYPTRAAAVRAGVERLLHDEREYEIAEQYRRAYAVQPQDESGGRAGLALMAAAVEREETPDPDPSTT